jgi:hypothetical protein
MAKSFDPIEEARKLRQQASRVRNMAPGLTQKSDQAELQRYADELERRAAEREKQAAGARENGSEARSEGGKRR